MIYTNISDLALIVSDLKQQGKKIIRTNGCFDLLHPGHIETFKKAKEYWDILVVWLNGDQSPYRTTKPGRPINDQKFRSELLKAIRFIDFVYIYDEESPIIPISILLPDVLIKWGDYRSEEIVWYKEIIDNWWQVVIIPTVEWYSTTSIVNKLQGV